MCPLVLEPDDATFTPQKNIGWAKEKIKKIEACNYNLSAGGEDKITWQTKKTFTQNETNPGESLLIFLLSYLHPVDFWISVDKV